MSRRSSGTRRATSFTTSAFLKVTIPDGNVKPRSSAASALPAFREAMENAADLPGPLLCHHAQGVGGCVAVMNHERFAGFDRCANMNAKALTLPFGCILVPVVVKASLADGTTFGCCASVTRSAIDGSRTSVVSGCTPTEGEYCPFDSTSA